jgi:hypothetical protein
MCVYMCVGANHRKGATTSSGNLSNEASRRTKLVTICTSDADADADANVGVDADADGRANDNDDDDDDDDNDDDADDDAADDDDDAAALDAGAWQIARTFSNKDATVRSVMGARECARKLLWMCGRVCVCVCVCVCCRSLCAFQVSAEMHLAIQTHISTERVGCTNRIYGRVNVLWLDLW